MLFPRRLLLVLAFIWVVMGFASGQSTLAVDEVEALGAIARRLGKKDWDFSVDPCSWATHEPVKGVSYANAVHCNCTLQNGGQCHVVGIILKAQNLSGSLPRELVRLPFLQEFDLTRNYLNGTIPPEWGSMNHLLNISLLGNRLSGSIPPQLANISTLVNLTLEFNQFSGHIPPEFGNFPRIQKLHFTSNNFTGVLPLNLANLATLQEFRIGDNNFQGSIPDFIQNWTNLKILVIQGSGLTGPIPAGIASLTNLTDLRISDLSGNDSTFPQLSNITSLKNLILRSCNIVGEIPSYIGEMSTLKVLDLSFNKLSGPITESFKDESPADSIYLTGNMISGPLPAWMLSRGENIDISYNNLTNPNSASCQPRSLNLFASSKGNSSGILSCFGITKCQQEYHSLYINCGGREVRVNDDNYRADTDSGGQSNFYPQSNWGFSSTGRFMDNDQDRDTFIISNTSAISGDNPQLYADARLSPLSLTYYGVCLKNGNYTVHLHFAEIMLTDDGTYSSVGRRLFDVYIQGKLVLENFNIEKEAGGVNRAIIRNFTTNVTDNSLDIRFYWAGKGTTGIPSRGVYGPLISAISVIPDYYIPPSLENGDGRISTGVVVGDRRISTGAVVGIVLGVLFTFFLVLAILWWKGCLRHLDEVHNDLKGLEGSFTLRQIKAATNNFDINNKIGEGGFGPVYKGNLSDGTIIAVKQLSSKSKQGNREFVNEIGMITALQHPHLVKLHGCCIEGNQLLLIYEYMENNSLARALFGPEEQQLHLDWETRHRICIGIARGLTYLHEESRLKIVHRDIKATNVLLDKNLVPKISDFGLAKLDEEDNTHISTRIAGTFGYMAPEYAMRGHLTDKADVYSFGVVLLEVVSGCSNTNFKHKGETFYLLDFANSLKKEGRLIELVDPRLESKFDPEEAMTAIHLGILCTDAEAAERPSMSSVVSILEGKVGLQEFVSEPNFSIDKGKKNNSNVTEMTSEDQAWTASSATSMADLYPISIDTEYWEKRDH